MVRLPVYIMEEVMRVKRTIRHLYQELGREPTPESIAERLGTSGERVSELLIWAEKVFSLDAPLSEEEENTLGDIIEDMHELGPSEITDQQLLREEIRKVLGVIQLCVNGKSLNCVLVWLMITIILWKKWGKS